MHLRIPMAVPTSKRPIESRILLIRGEKVLIDHDLADLYGVTTKRLNEQLRRNRDRFPDDFVFRLTKAEKAEVVANCDHLSNLKYSPTAPRAFTEHGAIMAATVLNSDKAVAMSVFVVRAFIHLRRSAIQNERLTRQLADIEDCLKVHDSEIAALVQTVRKMLSPKSIPKKRRIGFQMDD